MGARSREYDGAQTVESSLAHGRGSAARPGGTGSRSVARMRSGRRSTLVEVGAGVLMALLALVAAACGSASVSADGSTTTPVSVTTPATTPVDPGWSAPTAAALGITFEASCPMPWAPVYVEKWVYQHGTTSTGTKPHPSADPVNGLDATQDPRVDLAARWYSGPRQATDDSGFITLGSGDNATIIGGKDRVVYRPSGWTWIGDLDGDGKPETVVGSTTGAPTGAAGPVPQAIVVVPGTVGPGAHDPFTAGIQLPADAGQGASVFGVGDLDGDGADDVAMPRGDQLVIVSGRDLMTPGPGGRLDQVPTPIAVVPRGELGWLALAPNTYPVLGHPDGQSLVLLTDPTVSLKIEGNPLLLPSGTTLSAYLSAGHRIVVLKVDSGRSGTIEKQMWDLDAPCGAGK
jgi:hypothetical protein